MLLITITALPVTATLSAYKIAPLKEANNVEIFKEIEETEGKILSVDKIIGDIHVKYWEHAIDEILVKNDSILLHTDVENGDILKYERIWTDVELVLPDYGDEVFEPDNYFWKQTVLFPDEEDCTHFYTFYDPQEYPVFCWEVRHINGTTIMYSLEGVKIGEGIPAPALKIWKGFSCSGYDAGTPGNDPWINFRINADGYFQKWCTSTGSISLPSASTISSNVKDFLVGFFYEICHGDSNNFQCSATDFYYASGSHTYTAEKDMALKLPMKFAFIASCEGMTYTGSGSFSDEFRRGQMTGTVTVGYTGMASAPGWPYALQWQTTMFTMMDAGNTIKASFDAACAQYPIIAPNVVFVGDTNIKVSATPVNYPDQQSINLELSMNTPSSQQTQMATMSTTGLSGEISLTLPEVVVTPLVKSNKLYMI